MFNTLHHTTPPIPALPAKLKKLIFAALLLLSFTNAMAQGNLLISPQRVVFEGSRKSMDLNLANTGNDTARYVISLVNIKMKDDGSFEQVTEPDSGQLFADNYLRIFPKSVVLAPKEAQVVKVQLVKTNELKSGEYRSHLYFRAVPDEQLQGDKPVAKDSSGIAVKLKLIFGITIPIIIRIGDYSPSVSISDLSLEIVNDTLPRLNMIFNRKGNMSVYGNLAVNYTSSKGKVTKVGIVRGISVYTPNTVRHFRVDLDRNADVDYHNGKLTVEYTDESAARHLKLAEAALALQ